MRYKKNIAHTFYLAFFFIEGVVSGMVSKKGVGVWGKGTSEANLMNELPSWDQLSQNGRERRN